MHYYWGCARTGTTSMIFCGTLRCPWKDFSSTRNFHKCLIWLASVFRFVFRLHCTVGREQGNRFVVIPLDKVHIVLISHTDINRSSASFVKGFLILTTSQAVTTQHYRRGAVSPMKPEHNWWWRKTFLHILEIDHIFAKILFSPQPSLQPQNHRGSLRNNSSYKLLKLEGGACSSHIVWLTDH